MGSYAYKYCMCFTRKFRSPDAQPPPDVRAAHLSFASDAHALRRFVAGVQGARVRDAGCEAWCGRGRDAGCASDSGRTIGVWMPTLGTYNFLYI